MASTRAVVLIMTLWWTGITMAQDTTALDAVRAAFNRGQNAEAVAVLEKLLRDPRSLNPVDRHEARQLLGRALTRLARYPEAIAALGEAASIAQRLDLRRELALTHIYLGDAYERMKRHDEALEHYRTALRPLLLPADWQVARLAWTQIGDIHVVAGRYDDARRSYGTALDYAEQAGDVPLTAHSLDYLGYFYRSIGDARQAIRHHERAIALALGLGDTEAAWTALARAYNHLGLSRQALAWQEESRDRRRELLLRAVNEEERALLYAEKGKDHWRQGYILRALSVLSRELADLADDGLNEHLRKAVEYATRGRTPEWEGLALHQRALAGVRLGDLDGAARDLEEALAIWDRIGDVHARGRALRMRAEEIAERRGDAAGARRDYLQALQALGIVEAKDDIAQVYHRLSVNLDADGLRAAAIYFGKLAVNTVQGMRQALTGAERESQRAFLAVKSSMYRHLAELLIREGRLAEAQHVLGMLKEEEFFDFISRDAGGDPRTRRIEFLQYERPWVDRYEAVAAALRESTLEAGRLRQRLASETPLAADRTRLSATEREIAARTAALEGYFEALIAEFSSGAMAQSAARTAEAVAARVESALLQQRLAALGDGTVILHFVQTEERLSIIVTTASSQVARQVAMRPADLNRQIDRLRRVLRTPNSNPLPVAQELYQTLISPIAAELDKAGARTLMFYLDGALRYIPMAVLHDGERYLAERYALAVYTEVARDNLTHAPAPKRSIAGFGLTRAIDEHEPLPAVKEELETIVKVGGTGLIPGEVHLDERFSAATMWQALKAGHPLLHIASHFVFRPGTEATSYLLLGDGDRLTLKRIRDEKFDFGKVDLLTLSACETGLGGSRDAQGQEVEGLAVLVQRQGAKGVIATLWPVADASTALFMQHMYRLRERNLSKAEALRQAQIAFIRGLERAPGGADAERGVRRADPPAPGAAGATYAHPYFWAPFILMGNWL